MYSDLLDTLVESIVILKPNYYHFSGQSIEDYWRNNLSDDWLYIECIQSLIDGRMMPSQELRALEDKMMEDAECGALWNYVHISPEIDLETEISKVKALLLEDGDLEGHKVDDIASAYCYYTLGKMQVFSFQIDCPSAYTNMT